MLDKIKARISKDKAKGAGSRSLKQFFVTADNKPENIPVEGQFTLAEFARGSGVSRYKAGKALDQLLREGAVEVVPSNGKRTRYQIIGGGPNSSKVTEEASNASEQDEIDFVKTNEELVMMFVRATRSTDVFLYLTWLERKGEM